MPNFIEFGFAVGNSTMDHYCCNVRAPLAIVCHSTVAQSTIPHYFAIALSLMYASPLPFTYSIKRSETTPDYSKRSCRPDYDDISQMAQPHRVPDIWIFKVENFIEAVAVTSVLEIHKYRIFMALGFKTWIKHSQLNWLNFLCKFSDNVYKILTWYAESSTSKMYY